MATNRSLIPSCYNFGLQPFTRFQLVRCELYCVMVCSCSCGLRWELIPSCMSVGEETARLSPIQWPGIQGFGVGVRIKGSLYHWIAWLLQRRLMSVVPCTSDNRWYDGVIWAPKIQPAATELILTWNVEHRNLVPLLHANVPPSTYAHCDTRNSRLAAGK